MQSAQSICTETQSLLENREYEAAYATAEAGLQLYPEDGRLWETRGVALRYLGEVKQSMSSLEMATALIPLSPAGQLALASVYCRTGNVESAQCIYEHLTTRDDIPTVMLAELAFGLGEVGNLPAALRSCQEAVRRMPDCDQVWLAMAFFMARLEYSTEQISTVLAKALELCPNPMLYRVDFALLLARCDRTQKAYRLLCEVDIDELLTVRCPPRLDELVKLFREMGDDTRANACESHAQQLHEHWRTEP